MAITTNILSICNEEKSIEYFRDVLVGQGGYLVSFESDAKAAVALYKQNSFDLVIIETDLLTVKLEKLILALKEIDPSCIIIAIIKEYNVDFVKELLKLGVYDFIHRPMEPEKLFLIINKATQLHSIMVSNTKLKEALKEHDHSLEKQNIFLSKKIEESTRNLAKLYEDLRSTYMRTIKVLAQAIDARDHYTHSHSENVAKYAVAIAEEMGLSAKEIEDIREACELHDLGKIGVEDSILLKPADLSAEEWERVKKHPATGARILEPLIFLNDVIQIIKQHHEHYDGTGYPQGLSGEQILLGARIVHLADAYDSMRSARSYRKVPLSREDTILEIKNNSGTQFDPRVVEAFLKIVDKLE